MGEGGDDAAAEIAGERGLAGGNCQTEIHFVFQVVHHACPAEKVGTFDTELVEEFWLGFVRNAGITMHIRQLAGKNSHHIIEGTFKSAARSLRQAVAIEKEFAGEIPSTKGLL